MNEPSLLVKRTPNQSTTVVTVGNVRIGGDEITIIAGPCSVENEDQILTTARAVRAAGGHMLRGGAFKPRTSPYSFRGLGVVGLQLLAHAREETGLPIVTEVLTPSDVEIVATYADMLQIGTRNMHNFALLEAVGQSGKPVLLKRGFAATIEEWLLAAEYILAAGNPQIVLCERGIRTFEPATRYTLDIGGAVLIRQLSHLPIITDPSHGAGRRDLVIPLALASVAAGADGVILEVHPHPEQAYSDREQTLSCDAFEALVPQIKGLHAYLRHSSLPINAVL